MTAFGRKQTPVRQPSSLCLIRRERSCSQINISTANAYAASTFLPSFEPNVAYVLLQLRTPDAFHAEPDYREKRQTLLEIACGAAKNKFPHLVKVIGIGVDAPKFSGGAGAEDFILMSCETWTDEMKAHYEEQNKEWSFFGMLEMRQFNDRVTVGSVQVDTTSR